MIMKKLLLSQFVELLSRNDWRREQEITTVDSFSRLEENYSAMLDDYYQTIVVQYYGYATLESSLNDISIVYTESFNYDRCSPESLTVGTEGQETVWSVSGAVIIDDDTGVALDTSKLADYLDDRFSAIDYSAFKASIAETIDVDVVGAGVGAGDECQIIDVDYSPGIRFTGKLLSSVSTSCDNASYRYSGNPGCCDELSLYRTAAGRFVCQWIEKTIWQGDKDRHKAKVCETQKDVVSFFGDSGLAVELYAMAGIDIKG